jgi:hypothetical protein
MKHVTLESSNVSISIIMDLLPYLIVIGNDKQGARFEGKLGIFSK